MQQKQYDGPPSTFVNLKRIKGLGKDRDGQPIVTEKDGNGKAKVTFTLGLTNDQQGNEVNTMNELIDALLAIRGERQDAQVNLSFHVGESASKDGRKFPSGFLRVTEMIPKNAGGAVKTAYVPKASATKARTSQINKDFGG